MPLTRDTFLDISSRETERYRQRPRNTADSPDGTCLAGGASRVPGWLRLRLRPRWESNSDVEVKVVIARSSSLSFAATFAAILNLIAGQDDIE